MSLSSACSNGKKIEWPALSFPCNPQFLMLYFNSIMEFLESRGMMQKLKTVQPTLFSCLSHLTTRRKLWYGAVDRKNSPDNVNWPRLLLSSRACWSCNKFMSQASLQCTHVLQSWFLIEMNASLEPCLEDCLLWPGSHVQEHSWAIFACNENVDILQARLSRGSDGSYGAGHLPISLWMVGPCWEPVELLCTFSYDCWIQILVKKNSAWQWLV